MIYISINILNIADIIVYLNIDSRFRYEVFSFKYIINIRDRVCISIRSHMDVKLLVSNNHILEIKKQNVTAVVLILFLVPIIMLGIIVIPFVCCRDFCVRHFYRLRQAVDVSGGLTKVGLVILTGMSPCRWRSRTIDVYDFSIDANLVLLMGLI